MKALRDPSHRAAAWIVVAALAALGGCASRPPTPPAADLLHDSLYGNPPAPPDGGRVFALSPPMQRYADTELRAGRNQADPRRALVDALYQRRGLQLAYDGAATRSAAEAFDARAGNCLSLVIMTAAFARHLGLPVSFRQVLVDESYTRNDGLMLANGHVNLVLERLPPRLVMAHGSVSEDLIVDFLPGADLRGQRSLVLAERTIVAMYFNNLAAEALAAGRPAQAYAHARAALLEDAGFAAAANTLGVIYLRDGHLAQAEAALRHALAIDDENTAALSNLQGVLRRAGRAAEADAVGARLLALQPVPPFHHFDLGRQAMERGDFEAARAHFARELRRQPFQPEVHFWAAQAHWRLGNDRRAADHLKQAADNSLTPGSQRQYSAKLELLRGRRVQ